jgi:phosphate transport system permease protein
MRLYDISRGLRNRLHFSWMAISLWIVILLPFILFFGLLFKSSLIIQKNPLLELVFSSNWRPMSGEFGFWPFIVSSVWVSGISLFIAVPVCMLTAIHLTQYAKPYVLRIMHPAIDILAGMPSVIYGVWGILIIVPFVGEYLGPFFGKQISGYSILAGGLVLSIMIIPFILNIMIEVFNNVPTGLAEASLSLGATKWQTIKFVIIKKALPGIISAIGLGLSRAFGETIAVLMVVGNVVRIPDGAFQPGYPLPALIANNYGEMLSIPMYDSALMFSALLLFVVVIFFNFISRMLIVRYENIN